MDTAKLDCSYPPVVRGDKCFLRKSGVTNTAFGTLCLFLLTFWGT